MWKVYVGAANFLARIFSALARVREGSLLEMVDPGPDGKIGVLTVFSHPDDESIYSAGSLIKLKKDPRVRLHIASLTLGERSCSHLRLRISEAQMGRIRAKELESVAAVIGADEMIRFDYPNGGLESADQSELLQKVLDAITRTDAKIIVTHDPFGFSGHSDHRVASRVVSEAFKKSGAKKLYYVTLPKWYARLRIVLCYFPMKCCAQLVYYYLTHPTPVQPTVRVGIKAERPMKILALDEYASQKFYTNLTGFLEMSIVPDYEWFTLAAENK
jgi:LmbE family N-acetylglucosaminyl deacetylase